MEVLFPQNQQGGQFVEPVNNATNNSKRAVKINAKTTQN